jgi:hypothetical protein
MYLQPKKTVMAYGEMLSFYQVADIYRENLPVEIDGAIASIGSSQER